MKKYGILIIIVTITLGSVIFFFHNLRSPSTAGPTQEPTASDGKLKVVASFYPLYYFASEIARDLATITNITPAGAEPHDYEPSAKEVVKIEQSDLLILNGNSLEVWADNIKAQLKNSKTIIVIAGEGLANQNQDPHIWLDPTIASKEVDRILEAFVKADPDNQDSYKTNARLLQLKLSDLDIEFSQGLAECAKKDIVTSHAAFGYLARRYNFNEIALTGISPDEEPSTQKLAEIANIVKSKGIKYIFFETLVSPKLSETIANETGAQTIAFNPIEGLTKEEEKDGSSYFIQMARNLFALKLALECKM